MSRIFIFILLFLVNFTHIDANNIIIEETLIWAESPSSEFRYDGKIIPIYSFEDNHRSDSHPSLPLFFKRIKVNKDGNLKVKILDVQTEAINLADEVNTDLIKSSLTFNSNVQRERRDYYAVLSFIPLIKSASGQIRKVVSFKLEVEIQAEAFANPRNGNKMNSALANGDIYKFSVQNSGVYKLDAGFLGELGVDLGSVDPKKISIWGNGGGLLPKTIAIERIDDLEENAIYLEGEQDGSFDGSDYILFYAIGVDKADFDEEEGVFEVQNHIYSDKAYYFLKIGPTNGKRVGDVENSQSPEIVLDDYLAYGRYEEDKSNLLDNYIYASGSGSQWFGDYFGVTRDRNYRDLFRFQNVLTSKEANFKVGFVVRKDGGTGASSNLEVSAGGELFIQNFPGVHADDIESTFAYSRSIQEDFFPDNDEVNIQLSYPNSPGGNSEAWLDFIQLNVWSRLQYNNTTLTFHQPECIDYNNPGFELSNVSGDIKIWDITEPYNISNIIYRNNNGTASFVSNGGELKSFVAFDPNGSHNIPEVVGKIENQNIHSIVSCDLLIVYPLEFEEAVQKLKAQRESHNGYVVETVSLDKIYNEFSSGAQDISAIRDFAKMLLERDVNFKYLLLFGDGSFDYKNITEFEEDHNKVPVFETDNSLHPIESFPTDDFYALLSDDEGDNLNGAMDIAVGRIPVLSLEDADFIVDKIIMYDTDPDMLGNWRINLTYVADDEDTNTHLNQSDRIAEDVYDDYRVFNANKIYADAYLQETTPAGVFNPDVNEAINSSMFKGNMVVNYLGHGGPKGWGHERILTFNDINRWTNMESLPVFITATCSFTGYDDPRILSAGERVFLSKTGGAIGLFTTVRAVYSNSNEQLTRSVYAHIFNKQNNEPPTLGEILQKAKNTTTASTINSRKFTLIGDPSMQLALPKFEVVTTKVNGKPVNNTISDTLRALDRVSIEGEITNAAGQRLSNFNGEVFPTIFDKRVEEKTLGQDLGSSAKNFKQQKNIIFKGAASVSNGTFKFDFVVPKDINYTFGEGKISYYAHDGTSLDAAGFFDKIVIGGTNPDAEQDDEGPLVEVFMNTVDWVSGGITDKNPTLLVKLSDDYGINVVGNSIGHDLTGVLDDNTQNTYLLNDFYESELDDYTKGTVRYPLTDLEEGKHIIKVKAWDVANNSSEGFTEFVVAASGELALDHVLNYPNPFSTNTCFQFEHNMPNQIMDVQVQIFTVSGRLVKTLHEQIVPEGFRVSNLKWDGRDDFGDELAKGVYVYKVKVNAQSIVGNNVKTESDFEKLVIIN